MINNKEVGRLGEDIACKHIENNGYVILQRNFTTKLGEIDIIAKDGKYISFIEVKTRKGIGYGYPREAVGKYKQNKIRSVAMVYIAKNKIKDTSMKFDVIEILLNDNDTVKSLIVIKNAFE